MSVIPLRLHIDGVRNFPLPENNFASWERINITLPLASIFRRNRTIDVEIVHPVLRLDASLFKKTGQTTPLKNLRIRQIALSHGQAEFFANNVHIQLTDFSLRSLLKASRSVYYFTAPNLRVDLPLHGGTVTLQGPVTAEVRESERSFQIQNSHWQTAKLEFLGQGTYAKKGFLELNTRVIGNPEDILLPMLGDYNVSGQFAAHLRLIRTTAGKIAVKGTFAAEKAVSREVALSKLQGQGEWDSASAKIVLAGEFRAGNEQAFLQAASQPGLADIQAKNIPAEALTRILDIYKDVPLAGKVKSIVARFTPEEITATATLANSTFSALVAKPFQGSGVIRYKKEKASKEITFSAAGIALDCGQLELAGRANPRLKQLDFSIQATLANLQYVNPYTDFYLGLNLEKWHPEKGQGTFRARYHKAGKNVQIEGDVDIGDFYANRQHLNSLHGEFKDTPELTSGHFTVQDADLQGEAELSIQHHRLSLPCRHVRGEAAKIFKILDLAVPARGTVSGECTYLLNLQSKQEEIGCRFSADSLNYQGLPLERVRTSLHSDMNWVELPDLRFELKGGQGQAQIRIDYQRDNYSLRAAIKDMNLNKIHPEFQGQLDMELQGSGAFWQDALQISWRSDGMTYYADRPFDLSGQAAVQTDFDYFSIKAQGEALRANVHSPFSLTLDTKADGISGTYHVSLKDLNLLIPWKNNNGELDLQGQIYTDAQSHLHTQGMAVFSGDTLSIPNFSHSLNRFKGFLTFKDMNFNLQSLNGEMGGGKAGLQGFVRIAAGQVQDLSLNFNGQDLELYPLDRMNCRIDSDLNLKWLKNKLLLSGNMNFNSLNWERELDEDIRFSTPSQLTVAESRITNLLQFAITLRGDENIRMNNSVGRINGKFNLQLTGTPDFPELTGTIEGNDGEIYFSDRTFHLLKGKLVFRNKYLIDPLIEMEAESFIQSYRIRFSASGTASRLKPEFTSTPPLPAQDVLALISLGEIYRRPQSVETSSQTGSAALLTAKLTNEIKERASKILGIDLLRIDSLTNGPLALDTSRLTIGKSITKNLIVVYSTSLTTFRHEIVYFQYQFTPSLSLIGMRNEEGRYSFDFHYRKRY